MKLLKKLQRQKRKIHTECEVLSWVEFLQNMTVRLNLVG